MALSPKKTRRYYSFLFVERELKIAKLDKNGKRLSVFFRFPLPENVIVEGEVKDVKKLTAFLGQVKNKIKIGNEFVVVGIPEIKASTHSLTLPAIETNEIGQAIKLQAESFLPFPYKNGYLDWMLIGKTARGENRILLSAVPKKIIDRFVKAFESVGLKPVAFETTSLSLFRLLPPEGKKGSFAAEAGETSVVLILGNEGNIEACSVIREASQFLETAKKMSRFYLEKKQIGKNQKIYLCGKELPAEITQGLRDSLQTEPVKLKTGVSGIPQGRESELAILISLAKKDVSPPEDVKTINILPEKLTRKYQSFFLEKRISGLNFLFILMLLLLIAANLFSFLKTKNERQKLLNQFDTSQSLIDPNSTEFSSWLKKADLISQIFVQKTSVEQVLKTLLETRYQGIEFFGFNFNPNQKEVIITGRAKEKDSLLKLKEILEKKDFVSKISIPLSSLEQEKDAEFRVNLFVQ